MRTELFKGSRIRRKLGWMTVAVQLPPELLSALKIQARDLHTTPTNLARQYIVIGAGKLYTPKELGSATQTIASYYQEAEVKAAAMEALEALDEEVE